MGASKRNGDNERELVDMMEISTKHFVIVIRFFAFCVWCCHQKQETLVRPAGFGFVRLPMQLYSRLSDFCCKHQVVADTSNIPE
jgi:hypothetical protein